MLTCLLLIKRPSIDLYVGTVKFQLGMLLKDLIDTSSLRRVDKILTSSFAH